VLVKVIAIDEQGRIKLSRKALLSAGGSDNGGNGDRSRGRTPSPTPRR